MVENNMGNRCKYANECPVYLGKNYQKEMPLFIHRNVFCNRGIKGWRNCTVFYAREEKINATNLK